MAVEINIVYEGELRCSAQHGPSGVVLKTDAPVDNQGKGESFSPTDLVATALGSCMMTIMGIVARRNGYPIEGTRVKVLKEMVQEPVRRIGQLTVEIHFANGGRLQEKDRKILQQSAHTCPVLKSLHPDIEVPVAFHWE
ncbi:MAG: OsmC family protein [Candidatus Moduliflexus flocculans]|nr:OsmC family protein [Candidatus Moduliflexus flocculans]